MAEAWRFVWLERILSVTVTNTFATFNWEIGVFVVLFLRKQLEAINFASNIAFYSTGLLDRKTAYKYNHATPIQRNWNNNTHKKRPLIA